MPDQDRIPQLNGVEEDDPMLPDEDETEEFDPSLFADDEDEDEGADDEPASEDEDAGDSETGEEEPVGQDEPEAEQEAKGKDERLFTQADVERIIEQRLGRDRKAKTVRELEAILGKPLEEFIDDVRRQKIEEIADRYGLSEEEARQFIEQQAQLREFQQRQKELEEQQKIIQAKLQYVEDKRRAMSDPRRAQLIRQFEAEIDQIAEQFNVPFDVAARYVIGDKMLSGDLTGRLEEAAKQRVLRSKDNAAAPVSGRSGGASGPVLTPAERALAKALGLSAQEWAEEKAKMQRRR